MKISVVAIVAATFAPFLGGCSPVAPFDDPFAAYTQRIITNSPTAGNSQAANLALQTATPWPRNSGNTSIPGDGPRMVKAIQRFESGSAAPLGSSGAGAGGGSNAGAGSAAAGPGGM